MVVSRSSDRHRDLPDIYWEFRQHWTRLRRSSFIYVPDCEHPASVVPPYVLFAFVSPLVCIFVLVAAAAVSGVVALSQSDQPRRPRQREKQELPSQILVRMDGQAWFLLEACSCIQYSGS